MNADNKGLGLIHVFDEVSSPAGTDAVREKSDARRDYLFDKV